MRSEALGFLRGDGFVDPNILYLLQHEAYIAQPVNVSAQEVRPQSTLALAFATQTRNKRWRRHGIAARGSPVGGGVHSLISVSLCAGKGVAPQMIRNCLHIR